MGVTISSNNFSINLGYGGFFNLRNKVADLSAIDIGEHYRKLEKGFSLLKGKDLERLQVKFEIS